MYCEVQMDYFLILLLEQRVASGGDKNEFDQFVKHKLKVKYYIRYADDFVILGRDTQELLEILQGPLRHYQNS